MKKIVITDPNHWLLKLLEKMSKRKEELRLKMKRRFENGEFDNLFKNGTTKE